MLKLSILEKYKFIANLIALHLMVFISGSAIAENYQNKCASIKHKCFSIQSNSQQFYLGDFENNQATGTGVAITRDNLYISGRFKNGRPIYYDDTGKISDMIMATEFNKLSSQQKLFLQHGLQSYGYYAGSVDGIWGRNTAIALVKYAYHWIPRADWLNTASKPQKLYAKLINFGAKRAKATLAKTQCGYQFQTNDLTKNGKIKIQKFLMDANLYTGTLDGAFGRQTCSALQQFINENKINTKLPITLSRLQVAKSKICSKSNVKACSAASVCIGATKNVGSNKVWDQDSPTGRVWLTEAKRRNLNCGVFQVEIAPNIKKDCEDDPTLCSVVQLCRKAASTINGDRAWNTDAKAADYVALAQSTGVTCGVKPKPVVVAKTTTCEDDPALCSVVQLCGKAASTINGDRAWNTDSKAAGYVALANAIGLNCGVGSISLSLSGSEIIEYEAKLSSLLIKSTRLNAEINETPLQYSKQDTEANPMAVSTELAIFQTRKDELLKRTSILDRRRIQTLDEIEELHIQYITAQNGLALIRQEIETIEPLVKSGLASATRLLALQREEEASLGKANSAIISREQAEAKLRKVLADIQLQKSSFRLRAQEELKLIESEINRINNLDVPSKNNKSTTNFAKTQPTVSTHSKANTKPRCLNDPTKCSVIELCQQATGTNASGEKFWRMDAALQTYVDTAKSTGVTCGVVSKVIETAQLETCEDDPTKCSVIELCQQATGTNASGEKFWRMDAALQSYVDTAKSTGLTCGVQEDLLATVPEQKQFESPAPKKVLKYHNRKALVIGNANYVDQTPLKNPINDAKAVAAKLEQIGFEVTYKENLKVREFGRTITDFEQALQGSDIGLFYYAGHGIEVEKQNYLIPIDAEIRTPRDVRFETVMLEDAISASLNTGKLSMVLVDACRDNPFAGQLGSGTRSIARGLSVVEVETGPVNQIVSFAAASGEVAEDGSGNNSPYATALIELLDEPNLEVGKMFRLLGERVSEMTGGKQQPVKRDNLRGEDIFLVVE